MNEAAARSRVLGGIVAEWPPSKAICEEIFIDIVGDTVSSVALFEVRSPTAAPDEVLVTA
jgi:hypothetical protein